MFSLGALAFAAPVALLALATLPVIWWLLRIIPPAPKRIRFPAIRLIMGLTNPEESSAKTPLWLTILRLALVTFLILGAAHPLLNAGNQLTGTGPLVIVIDDGWASAKNWSARQNAAANLIDQAERDGRAVARVQGLAIDLDGAAGNLDPGAPPAGEPMADRGAPIEQHGI